MAATSDVWAVENAPSAIDAPDAAAALATMQAELDRLRDECEHLGRLAALGTLAATVAHEFNNLAAGVANSARFAELALGEAESPAPSPDDLERARRAVARCTRSAAKSGRLCDAILNFGGERIGPTGAGVAVSEAVEQAVEAMVRRPEQDGIRLNVRVPADLRARVDPLALEQVLLNLLLNARRALLSKPAARRRLTVEAESADDRVTLRVADTGCGIAGGDLPRIFDGFFTTASRRADGSGLGLTLARQLVERHGGTIGVESSEGIGTTFTLDLPRAA